MQKIGFSTTILFSFGVAAIFGQSDNESFDKKPTALEQITVIATRTERAVKEVSASVSVVGMQEIETKQPQSLDDLLRSLPNVESTGGPRRVSEKPMIRGLSGRRVLTKIDNTRQNFQSGHKGSIFLDTELLKQVDIVRGPASALYGSDAIGGVIAVTTKDPADFLKPNQEQGFRLKLGYQDANQEKLLSGSIYGLATEELDYLIYATKRVSGDIRQGGGEILANSGDEIQGTLFKLMWTPDLEHTFRFSIENHEQIQNTPINTEANDPSELSIADRTTERNTIRLSHHYESFNNEYWNFDSIYYRTEIRIDEKRRLDNRKDEISLITNGIELVNQSILKLSNIGSKLTYGLEWYKDEQTGFRNGETLKTYPSATVHVTGLFLQNELNWKNGLELIPGIRYDRFITEAKELSSGRYQDQLSPKFTASYKLKSWLRSFISYSKGFRVPNIQELYISGIHYGGDPEGIFVPNPNLKPEKSTNKEVGFKIEERNFLSSKTNIQISTTYFENELDDFIDVSVYPVKFNEKISNIICTNQGDCLYFENMNVEKGFISGLEAEFSILHQNFEIDISHSQTRGRNETNGQPLANIPADKWVLRIKGDIPKKDISGIWQSQLTELQDRVPVNNNIEKTPGYVTHDILVNWKIHKLMLNDLDFKFGIENISDERYRKHLSRLDETGRNLKVSLTYQY